MVDALWIVLVLAICIGAGYWFVVRSMRRLQQKFDQLESFYNATQGTLEDTHGTLVNLHSSYEATKGILAQSQQETANLSRALRSTHQQGHWGEIELQRIVQMAGMVQYCDFHKQVTIPGANGNQRPDLLIHLPNGNTIAVERTIVVDAKAPIASYVDAMAATDNATRSIRLKAYTQRVRENVASLAKKEYWQLLESSPELVVLFLPNEAMFGAALEHDLTLLDYAIEKNVLLASPITLIALLKAIAYGWSQENRAKSVQQIVDQSQTLHKEMASLNKQFSTLYQALDRSVNEYNNLREAYSTKVLPTVKQLRELDGTLENNEKELQVPVLRSKFKEYPIDEEIERLG